MSTTNSTAPIHILIYRSPHGFWQARQVVQFPAVLPTDTLVGTFPAERNPIQICRELFSQFPGCRLYLPEHPNQTTLINNRVVPVMPFNTEGGI